MTDSLRPDCRMADYDYPLPDHRIARYPVDPRDASRLLVCRDGHPAEYRFADLPGLLPNGALLVFNNTRVIRARLRVRKTSGATIEIFCLDPVDPCDFAPALAARGRCTWRCLVGNLKRWKAEPLLSAVTVGDAEVAFAASREGADGEAQLVRFEWDGDRCTFGELLEAAGELPIPPYLHRPTEPADLQTYQTVYSRIEGSVAAPTAGLHFTPPLLSRLDAAGVGRAEVTLHVGAGTFKPVKTATVADHTMHAETFSVSRDTVGRLLNHLDAVVAVGTTTVRTLESLCFIGDRLAAAPDTPPAPFAVGQWEPYDAPAILPPARSLAAIADWMDRHRLDRLDASTRIIIAPGYRFRLVRGLVTNFHQPQSTLLLLVSAFLDGRWRTVYDYALEHDFRFLSYGDGSLLLR